ncbi:MAG: hypothetical protein K5659_06145 [Lachnospiraceae bacterium]|nr:hypothetical protein [Lachnospiraceae bacterium]
MASHVLNKSKKVQEKINKEVMDKRMDILGSFFDIDEENRESKILEYMLDHYIINTGKALEEKRKKRAEEIIKKDLYFYNIDTQTKDENGNTEYDRLKAKYPNSFKKAAEEMVMLQEDKRFEDFDIINEAENGRDVFKLYYLDEMKKNPAFLNVLKARDTDELDSALDALEKETIGGFENYSPIEPLEETAKKNAEASDKFKALEENNINFLMNEITEKEWKDEAEKYALTDLHHDGLQKNSIFIHELYDEIVGVDYLTTSSNFRKMRKEFEKLMKMADKLAIKKKYISQRERFEYTKQVKKVLSSANYYLEHKTKINSKYAENRVKMVRSLRKKLKTNIINESTLYNSVYFDAAEWANGDMLKEIYRYEPITVRNRDIFLGKHTPAEVEQAGSAFSLGRSAGYSISVFVMLNMGYNPEDILDNQKLHNEKAKVFDEVFTRCTRFNEDDKKWIAKQIYDGFKKADAFQDEAVKKIDFTKNPIHKDKYFAMMNGMSSAIFDVFQEMRRVKDEIYPMYLEDKTIPNKTAEDFYDYRRERFGIMNYFNSELFQMTAPHVQLKLDPNIDVNDRTNLVNNAIKCKFFVDCLKEAQKGDISYTEYSAMNYKDYEDFRSKAGEYLGDYNQMFASKPKEFQAIADSFLDLSFFKNVKIDLNNKEQIFSNVPNPEDIDKKAAEVAFISKAEKAIKHFENDNFDDIEAVDNYAKDAATIAVYNMFKMTGKHPVSPKSKEPMDLDKAAKALSGNKVFRKMIRTKNGDGFLHPHDVLKVLKSPNKLVKLANAMEGKKAPGAEVKAKPKAPGHNLPRA